MRTKLAWLLAVPFLLLARPTWAALVAGATVAGMGLALRGWSAGTIRKNETLTTSGPYAFLRHPLYLGSFVVAIGLSVAGGHWIWSALVVVFFVAVYRPTVVAEQERLAHLFGPRYVEYAREVPALVPRLTPYRPPAASRAETPDSHGGPRPAGFSWSRYVRHREWEALLGTTAALALLAVKSRWVG